jgi:hypothetical protein
MGIGIQSFGAMRVDWEQRVGYERLRRERLTRTRLAASAVGALLRVDMANIRYVTATYIGSWAADKLGRLCLLPLNAEPVMWDFCSAASHHQIYSRWLGEGRSRAGISTRRGTVRPEIDRLQAVAKNVHDELARHGLLDEPLGLDVG